MLTKFSEVLRQKVTFLHLLLDEKRLLNRWQYKLKGEPFRKVNIIRKKLFYWLSRKENISMLASQEKSIIPLFYSSQRKYNNDCCSTQSKELPSGLSSFWNVNNKAILTTDVDTKRTRGSVGSNENTLKAYIRSQLPCSFVIAFFHWYFFSIYDLLNCH